MSDQTDNLAGLISPFGLSPEEGRIWLLLGEKGTMSALQLSRNLHLGRTKVYRILDKMITSNLVSQKMDDMGAKFMASSFKELEMLLTKREAETAALRESLPMIYGQLETHWGQGAGKSKVLYYTGLSGLEQVTWNSLSAKNELRIYEVEQDMTAFLPDKFSEKIREELVFNKIKTLQLTNKKHIEPYTKVVELVRKWWEVRYLDPKELGLGFECLIYNDVVAFYNFSGEEKFCVEIHNERLAQMQRQLFDFVWRKAEKMKIVSDEGEAILVQ